MTPCIHNLVPWMRGEAKLSPVPLLLLRPLESVDETINGRLAGGWLIGRRGWRRAQNIAQYSADATTQPLDGPGNTLPRSAGQGQVVNFGLRLTHRACHGEEIRQLRIDGVGGSAGRNKTHPLGNWPA